MYQFHGSKASGGFALGPVAFIDHGTMGLHRIVSNPLRERALFEAAVVLAKDELKRLQQKAQGEDADILIFQIALLDDESFTNEIADYIAAGAGCAAAVERAEQIFARRLQNVDNEYIQARNVDVRDACRRVVDILDGRPRRRLRLTEPSILTTDFFFPSDLFGLDPKMILGLAAERGTANSHASIVARNLGIPAVFGLGEGAAAQAGGEMAILDADEGTLTIHPSPVYLAGARVRRNTQRLNELKEEKKPLINMPSVSNDGVAFRICAGIISSNPGGVSDALNAGANSIGLVRTESMLIKGYTEEEQYIYLKQMLDAANGHTVTLRLFDHGSGVSNDWDEELTERMGGRSTDPSQLRAVLRASVQGDLRILVPDVVTLEDWKEFMAEIEEAKAGLKEEHIPYKDNLQVGCLIRNSAAALISDALMDNGANFLAVDISNIVASVCGCQRGQSGFRADDPAVVNLVKLCVENARTRNVDVGIIGVMAEDIPAMVEYLAAEVNFFCTETPCIIPLKMELCAANVRSKMQVRREREEEPPTEEEEEEEEGY